jgi:hypothetical protein
MMKITNFWDVMPRSLVYIAIQNIGVYLPNYCLKETEHGIVHWIHVGQNRYNWRIHVSKKMDSSIKYETGIF